MAIGKLTHVFRKGMISAPEPGAVTTSTSCSRAKVQCKSESQQLVAAAVLPIITPRQAEKKRADRVIDEAAAPCGCVGVASCDQPWKNSFST
jgi:hypothetical protein